MDPPAMLNENPSFQYITASSKKSYFAPVIKSTATLSEGVPAASFKKIPDRFSILSLATFHVKDDEAASLQSFLRYTKNLKAQLPSDEYDDIKSEFSKYIEQLKAALVARRDKRVSALYEVLFLVQLKCIS